MWNCKNKLVHRLTYCVLNKQTCVGAINRLRVLHGRSVCGWSLRCALRVRRSASEHQRRVNVNLVCCQERGCFCCKICCKTERKSLLEREGVELVAERVRCGYSVTEIRFGGSDRATSLGSARLCHLGSLPGKRRSAAVGCEWHSSAQTQTSDSRKPRKRMFVL